MIIINEMAFSAQVFEAAKAIYDLYNTVGGGSGGFGHVVFDDDNFDSVDYCLRDAVNNREFGHSEEVRQASIRALELCEDLTEDEVGLAVYLYRCSNRSKINEFWHVHE